MEHKKYFVVVVADCPECDGSGVRQEGYHNPHTGKWDRLYLYDNRERAWGAIRHILGVYAKTECAKFAPRYINVCHFELNSSNKKHFFYYWDEAIDYAMNNQNPLP